MGDAQRCNEKSYKGLHANENNPKHGNYSLGKKCFLGLMKTLPLNRIFLWGFLFCIVFNVIGSSNKSDT